MKAKGTYRDVPSKDKKEFQAFLRIINYLDQLSPTTADTCKSLRKLTPAKTKWTWNATYQKMFGKVKSIIRKDVCTKFYDEMKPLYI